MFRVDLDDDVVEITNDGVSSHWLVVKQTLEATGVRREGVDFTEMALAFPLKAPATSISLSPEIPPSLPQQQVFAFLPLRTYGTDSSFKVTLSSPPPGKRLTRTARGMNGFAAASRPSLIATNLSKMMCFVPLDGETSGFFRSVSRSILTILRTHDCVFADDGSRVAPLRVVADARHNVQDVLDADYLVRTVGKRYLHPGVRLTPALRIGLGIESVGVPMLLDALRNVVAAGKLNAVVGDRPGWLGRWFVCAWLFSKEDANGDVARQLFSDLRRLQIVPLVGGGWTALEGDTGGPAFFSATGVDGDTDRCRERHRTVEADLREVDLGRVVGPTADEIVRSVVHRMLADIGVQTLRAHEVITMHVIPALRAYASDLETRKYPSIADSPGSLTAQALIAYVCYIQDHLLDDKASCPDCAHDFEALPSRGVWATLRTAVPILTSAGWRTLDQPPGVRFSTRMGNLYSFDVLPGWVTLSDEYIASDWAEGAESNPDAFAERLNSWRYSSSA
ncbi:hypothetical protein BDK51DRAFT_50544 [Blyttiomyces helicus]|uniref:Uncharacterized protein n=1 Tax=Blyttiomyces helicus TaxID=388810 RepID=A0A4P9WIX3_9FUNG|nr:hypothetical protein BDK51DRAFT_50544 [Blyttiomyces helicus]|eukprot:RKO91090.1 hypothetical protein BDK51DRAFT_50544 [Blyttiomyces helicus]